MGACRGEAAGVVIEGGAARGLGLGLELRLGLGLGWGRDSHAACPPLKNISHTDMIMSKPTVPPAATVLLGRRLAGPAAVLPPTTRVCCWTCRWQCTIPKPATKTEAQYVAPNSTEEEVARSQHGHSTVTAQPPTQKTQRPWWCAPPHT